MTVFADWLADFRRREILPPSFEADVERVWRPLAEAIAAAPSPLVVGLCGAQGGGKSTTAQVLAALLGERGLRTVVLSLDDLYLPRADRIRLAEAVHPLFLTRGVPGTHDPALGLGVLDGLADGRPVALPRFDKGRDDRLPEGDWPTVQGPFDVILFEGWCVGAAPQPAADLAEPVNALERDEDPDGVWRAFVNDRLAGPYADIFARLDRLILLAAPGFEVVAGWRREQEAKLRARTGQGMDDDAIDRFVAHYERLTRWILAEAPGRADWVVDLGADRRPIACRTSPRTSPPAG